MSARLVGAILCDYSVAQCERIAMDRALPGLAHKGRPAQSPRLAVDIAVAAPRITDLVPNYNRLP
jgi:hypothetical protein